MGLLSFSWRRTTSTHWPRCPVVKRVTTESLQTAGHSLTSTRTTSKVFIYLFIFIHAISIAPLQVHYYSEALPTQHGYCFGISRRSATGNLRLKDLPNVPTWRLERESNPSKGVDSANAPHTPHVHHVPYNRSASSLFSFTGPTSSLLKTVLLSAWIKCRSADKHSFAMKNKPQGEQNN